MTEAQNNPDGPNAGITSSYLLAVSFGGGTNSTAMLCGMYERDIKPDLILFADTGAEWPHTYDYLKIMQDRIKEWWAMDITIVRKLYQGTFEGIAGECLRGQRMPSIAYGGPGARACSVKYKHEPQNRYLKKVMKERGVEVATRAIGFDANEAHRVKPSPDAYAVNWYPLVDWGWRREECFKAICRHKLPQPGKSSCYFCPASKPSEVFNLKKQHPELWKKAMAIEEGAQPKHRKLIGLGGEGNLWSKWADADDAQLKLLDMEPMHRPCGCMDG